MASEANKLYLEQYKRNLTLLAQQEGSLQRNSVNVMDVEGLGTYINAIGQVEAAPVTTRHAPTPIMEVPQSRRQLLLADWEWSTMIDRVDMIRSIADPTSKYVQVAMYAFGTRMDDTINAAALGNARAGMAGETVIPLPDSRKLGLSTDIDLDLETLLEIKYMFDSENVNPRTTRNLVIHPMQMQTLLASEKLTSADYNTVRALIKGDISTFLGFNFIQTTRLELDGDGKRHCIAYTKDAVTLGFGLNPVVEMDKDPAYSFNKRIYTLMSLGAVRLEEVKVVEALIKE